MPEIDNDAKRIIADLQCVRTHGEFPKGRNYLFSRYKNSGLVIMGNKTKEGYLTPRSKVKLTKKGYGIVKVANKNNQFL
jgi:hypothetical protein